MSAEHERSKPLLPTRPPRPHPQGLMRTLSLAAVAVTVSALALTACDPAFPQGPAGTVAGRSSEFHSSTKTRWYFLTTTGRFRVDFGVYQACAPGDDYPACAS